MQFPPLPQQGRQPIQYRIHKPGTIAIRVRRKLLVRSKNLIAKGLPDSTRYVVLPAAHQSMRLLWRAVREYQAGRYFRALGLAELALNIALSEVREGYWYSFHILDVIRGFIFDIMDENDDSPVGDAWREQADWWAGGKWPGGGRALPPCVEICRTIWEEIDRVGGGG